MFKLNIPDFGPLNLEYLVIDYNGTLALDGKPVQGAKELILQLTGMMNVQVLTADTLGGCRKNLEGWPVEVTVLGKGPEAETKLAHIESLGPACCACVGNGRNDRLMLKTAALGIAVMAEEGAAKEALSAADIVVPGIKQALSLFTESHRLLATLRS